MRAKYYDRNSLFRITLQVFLDRYVEREIQSLLVHCTHQEEGCDWKDELRKRDESESRCIPTLSPTDKRGPSGVNL